MQACNNSIMMIDCYRKYGTWVFDDQARGLVAEAFVCGTQDIIDRCMPKPSDSCRLTISANEFPGARHRVDLVGAEHGGHWYLHREYGIKGWLCPALLLFFPEAPQRIWFDVQPC
jgi:hypothetical protein